jgi:hypothetical protein
MESVKNDSQASILYRVAAVTYAVEQMNKLWESIGTHTEDLKNKLDVSNQEIYDRSILGSTGLQVGTTRSLSGLSGEIRAMLQVVHSLLTDQEGFEDSLRDDLKLERMELEKSNQQRFADFIAATDGLQRLIDQQAATSATTARDVQTLLD